MTARLHSLKAIASIALVAASCVGFAACGGGGTGSRPVSGDQMTILPPAVSPDLAVGAPSVSDSGPAAGASFTLSATVRNDGDGASPATTLRYYRSTDAAISTSDTAVGTDAVDALAASGTSAESIALNCACDCGDLLLRRLRGRGGGRVRHRRQLLVGGAGHRAGAAGQPEPGGWDALGERQWPGGRREFHPVGDGAQRRGTVPRRRRRCATTDRPTRRSRPRTRRWARTRWTRCRRRGAARSRFR